VRVTYHDPGHRCVSDIHSALREELRRTSAYEFVEMRHADVCCGGAGTYSMNNRGVHMAHFRRVKEPSVRDSRESIPLKHLAVLLDEADASGEGRTR
jgi:glycolate oxidase iron-sulfur subunit